MGRVLQPVSVDGIEFDALIGSTETYEAKVPEYTVETGFPVGDTIILQPEDLDLTLFVSDRPVTWAKRFGTSSDRVGTVSKQLKELYMKKKLITITTSTDTYTDMAITSITFTKSTDSGYSMEIPLKAKKVRITTAKTTTIPASYGKSGATKASAGTASTGSGSSKSTSGSSGSSGSGGSGGSKDSGNKKSGSILYNAASSLGLI